MDTMPNRERCVRPKRRCRLITGRFETVDSTPEPSKRAPQRWGKLLQIEGQRTWRPEELGEILRHQLNAPLGSDLEYTAPATADHPKALAASESLKSRGFG